MIPEPSTPLWSAVRARYDSWPPDNEDIAGELAWELRDLHDTTSTGSERLRNNANVTRDHWRDEAGGVLSEKVAENAADWANSGSAAQQLASVAERYAADLTAVKQAIVATIGTNEREYELLLLNEPTMAGQFANEIADYLQNLIADQVTPESDADALKPPKNGTPAQNAVWWKSLTKAQQDELLRDHPDWLGNLDGLPGAVRSQANLARLPIERAALEKQRAEKQHEYDLSKVDPTGVLEHLAKSHLDEIDAKLHSLDVIQETMAKGNRQLLLLDTSHERAEAAIAVGNVDTAKNVAVFTPGLTSTVDGGLSDKGDKYDEHMDKLRAKADEFGGPGSTATVTWIGYQVPQLNSPLNPTSAPVSRHRATPGPRSAPLCVHGAGRCGGYFRAAVRRIPWRSTGKWPRRSAGATPRSRRRTHTSARSAAWRSCANRDGQTSSNSGRPGTTMLRLNDWITSDASIDCTLSPRVAELVNSCSAARLGSVTSTSSWYGPAMATA